QSYPSEVERRQLRHPRAGTFPRRQPALASRWAGRRDDGSGLPRGRHVVLVRPRADGQARDERDPQPRGLEPLLDLVLLLGGPSPSRAGTNHTSPVSVHAAATASDSAADEMRPRSSRSHSTALPADSITASMPHVTAPPRRHATIGNVPPPPRTSNAGRAGPTHRSSIPPVPNVILARPGRGQPCPPSYAGASPALPA